MILYKKCFSDYFIRLDFGDIYKEYVVRTLQIWNKTYISDKNGNFIKDFLSSLKKKKYRVSEYFLFTLNQLIELFVFTVRNNTKVYKHTQDEIYMTQVRIQLINSGVGVQIITPGALRCACVLKISFSYLKKTTKVFINTLYIYM